MAIPHGTPASLATLPGTDINVPKPRLGIVADQSGHALKVEIVRHLRSCGCDIVDFGANQLEIAADHAECMLPLARAIEAGELTRGIALSGSGVGLSIAANKFAAIRAGLVHDVFSAHQGVEEDGMNVMCLGAAVVGTGLALDLVHVFLNARYSGTTSQQRRLAHLHAIDRRDALPCASQPVGSAP
jgi:ribose 5-phosphate isomerase B